MDERNATTPESTITAVESPHSQPFPTSQPTARDKQSGDVEKQAPPTGPGGPGAAANPPEVAAQVKEIQQSARRWLLLSVFCVAMFLDVAARAGLFVFVEGIAEDLEIQYQQSTWILNSYTITFCSILPLSGRLADLFSARPVFIIGFVGFGLCQIIISVLSEEYAFFVFRGLAGCFAGATVPAAFRLIAGVFPPKEIPTAMSLFALAGALGNSLAKAGAALTLGLTFGGIIGIIPNTGQMAGWRWFFRIVGLVCVPFCPLAYFLCPKTQGSRAKESSKWRQIDLPGAFLIFAPIVLLVLGLTFGASYGWRTANFLVPFLLAWPLFVGFFIWEAYLPPRDALVPPSFWKIQNVVVVLIGALVVLPFWVTIQLPLIERFEVIYGNSKIVSSVRCLPIGVSALAVAVFIPKILHLINLRATMSLALFVSSTMFLPLIYSHGEVTEHAAYWRYLLPAMFVGSGAMMVAFTTMNIFIVKSVPPAMAGVAGAFLQVALQTGASIALGIQQGLLSVYPGSVENFKNVQVSWWVQFGWQMASAILLGVMLRNPQKGPPGPPAAQAPKENGREKERV